MLYVRSILLNIFFYIILGIMCVWICAFAWLPQKWIVWFCNHFFVNLLRMVMFIFGLKVEVRGKENIRQDGVIYAIKHESAIETYILTSIITKGFFILKKELTYIPIFGWAQARYGMVSVDRKSGGAGMKKMLKDSQNKIAEGKPILIFPEGTRMKPGAKTVYKPGLYFMAENLNVPVIPVALNTGLFWAKKSFLRYSGTIIFDFLEPMAEGLDKSTFMKEVEAKIETRCAELNAEAIAQSPAVKANLASFEE